MPRHHVIISGTGRTGTTFLVQLLTALKLDTGFDTAKPSLSPICNAGMEVEITQADAPYIVKRPDLCDRLDEIIRSNTVVIDHAIIPVRDLHSAAESRRTVSRMAGDSGETPGGLWHTKTPGEQELILTRQLYNLIFSLVKYDVPVTLLLFPRLANDPEYLYKKLAFLFPKIGYREFLQSFREVAMPKLIHNFEATAAQERASERTPNWNEQIRERDAVIVRQNFKIDHLRRQRKLLIFAITISIFGVFALICSSLLL
jgi:hypothetical protein